MKEGREVIVITVTSKCQYVVPVTLINNYAEGFDGFKKNWFDRPDIIHVTRDSCKVSGSTEIISIEGENDKPKRI